jgi:hypothetical protein
VGLASGTTTRMEALEEVLSLSGFEAILDEGRLRVLPSEQARAFWLKWGAAEGYR